MKLNLSAVLSDGEIHDIHEATVEILTDVGVQMGDRDSLELLGSLGLEVSDDTIRFPRAVLEDAIAAAPATIEVHDREGDVAFVIGEGSSKIAAGHNAVFWVDSETGATRPSRLSDVERFARICDDLEKIDMIGIPVMPQDVRNPKASLLYAVEGVIRNSKKPIFFSTDNRRINRGSIELLEAGYAGDFAREVYGICQLSPTSPLYWERGVMEAIRDTLTTSVPLAILPEPNAGVSAPYTLAGLVTLNNVECLSGIAMVELIKPGASVLYANSWTATDMNSGAALVGSTETTICRIAGAELARFYGLPSHTTAPNSDNHAHDEQNAWEKTFSTFCSVASGNDLIVNCGMFATGMTCSDEQLVIDEEISAMALRIGDGIRVDEETIATDLIKSIGPRGDYLTSEHTLNWLRRDEYIKPRVSVRSGRAIWESEGSLDTYARARRRANSHERCGGTQIDAVRADRMNSILDMYSGGE